MEASHGLPPDKGGLRGVGFDLGCRLFFVTHGGFSLAALQRVQPLPGNLRAWSACSSSLMFMKNDDLIHYKCHCHRHVF
jgi:hypothetical protein